MSEDIKLNKVYKLLETTENNEEKNLIMQYLSRKVGKNTNLNEKYTTEIETNEDPIISLIKKENIISLQKILQKTKVKWDKYMFYKNPPIHQAIENGDSKTIKLLLINGHPLWLLNKNRHTPLELACLYKDPSMIKVLMEYGANIKKILYLRENTKNIKFFHTNIDFLILVKNILMTYNNIDQIRNSIVQKNYIDIVGLEDFTWEEFRFGLKNVIELEFPNLIFLYEEIKNSKFMDDYLIFNFIFDLDFDFNIECDSYFFLELDYNRSILTLEDLKNKFYNDYKLIYPINFLEIIWNKYLNKIK